MALQACQASLSIGFEYFVPCDGVLGEFLALDGEKAVLEGRGRGGKQGAATVAEKAMTAMKSHSEAERINSHLDRLRGLIPSKEKMDKATLLAESRQASSTTEEERKTNSTTHDALKSLLDRNTADLTDFSPRATVIRPSKERCVSSNETLIAAS